MKITRTPKHTTAQIKSGMYASDFYFKLIIVCCGLFSLSSIDIAAQANPAVAPVPEISTEDYPGPKWKSPVDFGAVLTSEQSNTALKLADQNLLPHEIGLYTGYDRMLTYMQEDLINQVAVEEIALKSFNRVVEETPGDAVLKNMHAKDFQTLFDTLLTTLVK